MDFLEGGRREKWEGKAVLTALAPARHTCFTTHACKFSFLELVFARQGGHVFSSLKHDGKLPNDYFQNE